MTIDDNGFHPIISFGRSYGIQVWLWSRLEVAIVSLLGDDILSCNVI